MITRLECLPASSSRLKADKWLGIGHVVSSQWILDGYLCHIWYPQNCRKGIANIRILSTWSRVGLLHLLAPTGALIVMFIWLWWWERQFQNWISSQRAEISLGSNLPGSLKWWCAIILLTYAPTTFWIFTQSIDAIDVTIVTLSCLNSINTINIKRCWIADWMLNVQMLQCSNVGGVYSDGTLEICVRDIAARMVPEQKLEKYKCTA